MTTKIEIKKEKQAKTSRSYNEKLKRRVVQEITSGLLSINYLTPDQAHNEMGIQKKKWKQYRKARKPRSSTIK